MREWQRVALVTLLCLELLLTGSSTQRLSAENNAMLTDACDPSSPATMTAYCAGESASTSTATVRIRSVVTKDCSEFGFDQSVLDCVSGERAHRMSLDITIDEANHVGCNVTFDWAVVPTLTQGRTCGASVCTSDVDSSPECVFINPLRVHIEVPAVLHEMPLEPGQFTPYEYVLLEQPEYFPQRKKHAPVKGFYSGTFMTRADFENAFQSAAVGSSALVESADAQDFQAWTVIDPNYESKTEDALFCQNGKKSDTAGKHQCCFRSRMFSAEDDDNVDDSPGGQEDDLDAGLRYPSRNSPRWLDFCSANTNAHDRASGFAWSFCDEGADAIESVHSCRSSEVSCRHYAGYFMGPKPFHILSEWIERGRRVVPSAAGGDDREYSDDTGELADLAIAGITTGDELNTRVAIRRIHTTRDIAPTQLAQDDEPAASITTPEHLAAWRQLLNRDMKNVPSSTSATELFSNGTWVTTPAKKASMPFYVEPRVRRLRCGYCANADETNRLVCPSHTNTLVNYESAFHTCPTGDVSQDPTTLANVASNPSLHESKSDGSHKDSTGGAIRWSEIRHVRAFASSRWFLGVSPMCAAMRPRVNYATTHINFQAQVTRYDPVTGRQDLETTLDLATHGNQNSYATGTGSAVHGDVQPGERNLYAYTHGSDPVYMPPDDRVVVCDSALYDSGSYSDDHFARTSPTDIFENPFASVVNPRKSGLGCVGCTSRQQFLGRSDPDELMLWYYLTGAQYEATWVPEDWKAPSSPSSDPLDLETYQNAVRVACGRNGVGMDLFQVNGCDAVDADSLRTPPSGEQYVVPDTTEECLALYDADPDAQRSCTASLPIVMPGALACSGRLPRLCAPARNTPAHWNQKLAEQEDRVAAASGSTLTDVASYPNHGFPPDVNINAPNAWLGRTYGASNKRSFYHTNERNPQLGPREPLKQTHTMSLFITGEYAVQAPVYIPCIYQIAYTPCVLTHHDSVMVAAADQVVGSFKFRLAPTTPTRIPRADYMLSVSYGSRAACGLRLAAQTDATFMATLRVTVVDTDLVVDVQYSCSVVDANHPLDEGSSGVITVTSRGASLLYVPLMSCSEQTAFMASLEGLTDDVTYTPQYFDAGNDPCVGNAEATSFRIGGVPTVLDPAVQELVLPEDESDPVVPSPQVTSDPTPTPTPTPTGLVDNVGEDDAYVRADDHDELLEEPSPTPTPPLHPGSSTSTPTPTIDPADDSGDMPISKNNAWIIAVVAIVGVVVLVVAIVVCYCTCCRTSKKDSSSSLSLVPTPPRPM